MTTTTMKGSQPPKSEEILVLMDVRADRLAVVGTRLDPQKGASSKMFPSICTHSDILLSLRGPPWLNRRALSDPI